MSVRLIARPLGALADQLTAQQGRLQPLPVHSDSSDELQALVRAFNQLVQQVTAAAQARQQLLAGVSHDLRTPLARLRLRAETQCEPALADALTADLVALERIVNQFLAYVQGDNGAPLGQPAPLARSVAGVVQRYADEGLAVRLVHDDVSPPAQQMPDLAVQRLLANLIDNALAYGAGPVDVALRANGLGAELCVSDGGPGMSDEEFERAQQPFVRLTRARSELGHCGLGLAIVAQMARQLGGRLRVERGRDGRFGIVCTLPRHAP
jgi:two-component system osmolarity sensor histidine kinase EnvZ